MTVDDIYRVLNLVERGLVGKKLDRFAVDTGSSFLAKIAQLPFYSFDRLNQVDILPDKSVVNIIVKGKGQKRRKSLLHKNEAKHQS